MQSSLPPLIDPCMMRGAWAISLVRSRVVDRARDSEARVAAVNHSVARADFLVQPLHCACAII